MAEPVDKKELRVLMLEDTLTDAELVEHELRKAGIAYLAKRVETREAFIEALEQFRPDIVLSDYRLPNYDGMSALKLVRQVHPEIPVIMVTGALSDIEAVELIHVGARDYVLKDRLARLGPAVQRALSAEQGIRARKAAERALRESEASIRALVEHSPVAMLVDEGLEADERIVMMNRKFTELFGYTIADVPDVMHWWPLAYPDEQYREQIRNEWIRRVERAIQAHAEIEPMEAAVHCKDGSLRYVRVALSSIGARNIITFEDMTERRRIEKELHENNQILERIFDSTNVCVVYLDRDFNFIRVNRAYAQVCGHPQEFFPGKNHFALYPGAEVEGIFRRVVQTGEPVLMTARPFEFPDHPDWGVTYWDWTLHPIKDAGGEVEALLFVLLDVSERKRAEEKLLRLNRTLRAISASNHALVHGESEQMLLEGMCRAATEVGYVLAWVGYAMRDENKSIVPVAVTGSGVGYVEGLSITWSDEPRGRGPTGTAVRTGQTQICQDIQTDPRMQPWREAAAKYGFASSIALPLRQNGGVIGAMTLYAPEPNVFDAEQVALLEEMAGDVVFGITNLRTRIERDQAVRERQMYVERLRASMEDALQAISTTLEMRDPYTAGHQRRVAQLAGEIAREMGLPEERVHGIHLAGVVHDVGKIHIPAEILSKPGRLSEIEYNLIKLHPQSGYDILKGIDFPWPIAQVVLQHHERLDGSGYPQGLKGDAIMLEASIVGVADVVEAMASHRPYRPTLGIHAALEEIAKQRGVLYDAQVVDACLRLFREQGYVIS